MRLDAIDPAASPSVAIRLEGVVKRFGDDDAGRRVAKSIDTGGVYPIVAVAGIDLDVYDGEFFSMLGPSGSGKTTTLRMIAGFELPSEGRILLHGQDVTTVPPFDRDVNTVFQDYALFPHMTVGDNVAYGLMVRKVAKPERAARVTEALRMVRLEGYERRIPEVRRLAAPELQRDAGDLRRPRHLQLQLHAAVGLDPRRVAVQLQLGAVLALPRQLRQRRVGLRLRDA